MKVSVCITTYNQDKYIAQAIEGVLIQKITFPIEIIISEDCSTDKTREICIEYQKKYPNKIYLILREKNIGMMRNFIDTVNQCTGKYIAWCEGDDYWTDPLKLQKQVDFLDNHPDYTISSHNINVIHEGTDIPPKEWIGKRKNDTITLEDLLQKGSGGATCSLVFRNKIFGEFPEWYKQQKGGDWTLQILCASKGKMKYFNKVMGVYRKHEKGAIFNQIKNAKNRGESCFALPSKYTLEMIDVLNKHFDYKYDKQLRIQSTYWYHLYINEYLKINNIKMARKYAIKILKEIFPLNYWKNTWITKKVFIKLLALVILPNFLIRIIKQQDFT